MNASLVNSTTQFRNCQLSTTHHSAAAMEDHSLNIHHLGGALALPSEAQSRSRHFHIGFQRRHVARAPPDAPNILMHMDTTATVLPSSAWMAKGLGHMGALLVRLAKL